MRQGNRGQIDFLVDFLDITVTKFKLEIDPYKIQLQWHAMREQSQRLEVSRF